MLIDLDRKGLVSLIKGTDVNYNKYDNPLVKKGGHSYSDQYGRTSWSNLENLTEAELYTLYLICRDSWN
jgi:hypothetical protein